MKSSEKKGILILILVSIVIIAVIYGVHMDQRMKIKTQTQQIKQ